MVPLRVTLKGFLSYRDEQTLDFTDASLWMLGGPNGSGKSAVFDAVTYALFGKHRSGTQNAEELINKNCDGFTVEFEFETDRRRYLARRTLKRTSSGAARASQQILAADGDRGWTPVPDTNKKSGFSNWVDEHIGLQFETFTASVLLMQNQAEKLLSRSPAERFEVLAEVVDLKRFVRLHARVDDRRRALRAELEVLEGQWAGLAAPSSEDVQAARDRVAQAEQERRRIAAEMDAMQNARIAAHRWRDLQARISALQQQRAQIETLIKRSAEIERDAGRLHELDAVIPSVETVIREGGGVEDARRKLADCERESQAVTETLNDARTRAEHVAACLARLRRDLTRDESDHAARAAEMQSLAAAVARADSFERQRLELDRQQAELSRMAPDLSQHVAAATALVDELTMLEGALPLLRRLHSDRAELGQCRRQIEELAAQMSVVADRGRELTAQVARGEDDARRAEQRVTEAQRELTTAQTLAAQAVAALDEFRGIGSEPVCRLCGQALTPQHRAEELARRSAEAETSAAKVREVQIALEAARGEFDRLQQILKSLTAERDNQRDVYRQVQAGHGQAQQSLIRLGESLSRAYHELPESVRLQVAATMPGNWAATTFPAESDLADIAVRVAGLASARQSARALVERERAADALRGGIEAIRRTLGDLEAAMRGDPPDARQRHSRGLAELDSLGRRIAERRAELQSLENEQARWATEQSAVQSRLAEIGARIEAERARLQLREAARRAAIASLPESWQPIADRAGLAELSGWKSERDRLRDSGVDERMRSLAAARIQIEDVARQLSALESEAAATPEAARVSPDEIDRRLAEARAAVTAAEGAERAARDELVRLEGTLAQRRALSEQLAATRRDHERHRKLAELLGRDRLQMHLVRRAERQIIEQANSVLDRISGGDLHLRRRDPGDDRDVALDLEVINRATSDHPIAAAFLSGSQRFRVAVSLALGIGRFASGQHRPIESVIIDEGFGCLDREGRQVMIQELQNLRSHMKRILLVSHQEEFVDAFADGYRFELIEGATRVTRIQR